MFRVPYPKERERHVGLVTTMPSLTDQEAAHKCTLEYMLNMFSKTGVMPNIRLQGAIEGDFSDLPDYQEMRNRLIEAQEQFMQLPAKVRKEFDNDPVKMVQFLQDKNNYDKAVELGLVIKKQEVVKNDGEGQTVQND